MYSLTETSLSTLTWPNHLADSYFGAPFIDIDQERTAPVPHRHIHGGFEGTESRFSFYFPLEGYEGRFFQHVSPVPQDENLAVLEPGTDNKISSAIASGAYFIETNGGGLAAADPTSGMDPTIGAYRVSAAATQFSREVARVLYQAEHHPYGYLYGGSGGAYRTMGTSENTDGVWDGFLPYVPGTPMAIPNVFSVRMHAQRVLRHVFPQIVDAYDGGGDPAALDLTAEERAAFDEVTRMGFPPRSWFDWETMGMHSFGVLYPGVMAADPTYFEDFWTKDGYLGADPNSSIHKDRVQLPTTIVDFLADRQTPADKHAAGSVDESYQYAATGSLSVHSLKLADSLTEPILGALLIVTSGEAAGTVLRLSGMDADVAHLEPGQDGDLARLRVGDSVVIDNSGFLAAQTYHRHQIPGPEYSVWDQFKDAEGRPLFPQRPNLLGPMFSQAASGTVPTGHLNGKVIMIASLLDHEAFPWQADWYRERMSEYLGGSVDESFRLWYVDNALHGDDGPQAHPDRTVSYIGALQAGLRQLAAWVEKGIEPAATSAYEVRDGQVSIPETAAERRGIQPTVDVTIGGADTATVRAGQKVTLQVHAEAPSPSTIVEVRPVFGGQLGDPVAITPGPAVSLELAYSTKDVGTHFVAVRVAAQAEGDEECQYAHVFNVGRARVNVVD